MPRFGQSIFRQHDESSPNLSAPRDVPCWISFGGNVGDVRATFDAALALLSLHCQIELCQRSGLYCSSPMGSRAGSPFLNSICGLNTQLDARDLLSVLQSVETQLGRVRDICWGPRTLDLDLLSYGSCVVAEPHLVIPHPALTYRRFVLDPLVEIDQQWCHPEFSESAGQLLGRLRDRPLKVALLDLTTEQCHELSAHLVPRFPHVQFVSAAEDSGNVLPILLTLRSTACNRAVVDLSRSPGDALEKLTSAFTAIFDSPVRVSDW